MRCVGRCIDCLATSAFSIFLSVDLLLCGRLRIAGRPLAGRACRFSSSVLVLVVDVVKSVCM